MGSDSPWTSTRVHRRKTHDYSLNELERTGGRYGLQTMCEGGGQANVTIIESLA